MQIPRNMIIYVRQHKRSVFDPSGLRTLITLSDPTDALRDAKSNTHVSRVQTMYQIVITQGKECTAPVHSTPGASVPLPHLTLLEIFHRRPQPPAGQ